MIRALTALFLWLWMCMALAAAPPHYAVTDLGPDSGERLVINDHGQIAGSYFTGRITDVGNHGLRGFLWAHGKRSDLGLLPDYSSTIVQAINHRGQIAGNLDDTTDGAILNIASHIFRWEKGRMQDLGVPDGDVVSEARAINDAGEIVGCAYGSGRPVEDDPALTEPHAVVFRRGQWIDLGIGKANAINTEGQIVGETPNATGLYEATLWNKGKVLTLGILGTATAINSNGQILVTVTSLRAMLWQKGHSRFLPIPSGSQGVEAIGLNDRGQIIGSALFSQNSRAMLWQSERVFDLNSLISSRSGWILSTACGINNHGQIVGQGLYHGQPRAFLLTPR